MTVPTTVARNVEKTQRWLKALAEALELESEDEAWSVLRGVLMHLRDRLPPDEAADLAAELPTLVRGAFYEGWKPSRAPEKDRDRESFLVRVSERMGDGPPVDLEDACRAVFALLDAELEAGEIDDVILSMPGDIRPLWPDAAVQRAEMA